MRTALFLLLLLAVAAVPGSIFPQRLDRRRPHRRSRSPTTPRPGRCSTGSGPSRSTPRPGSPRSTCCSSSRSSAASCPAPGSTGTSCARPRRAHPARLDRLPAHGEVDGRRDARRGARAARATLRARRYRVARARRRERCRPRGVPRGDRQPGLPPRPGRAARRGRVGHLLGLAGDVILPVGQDPSPTPSARYDTFSPGPWVDTDDLPPFTLRARQARRPVRDQGTGRGQFGMPREFRATTTFTGRRRPGRDARAAPSTTRSRRRRHRSSSSATATPRGSPCATATARWSYSGATPFLPQDGNYTSLGVVKVPGAQPDSSASRGSSCRPAVIDDQRGPHSVFPDALDPRLVLTAFSGDLFPGGAPAVGLHARHRKMTPLPGTDGEGQLRILLRPGRDLRPCPTARARSPSTGSSASPASRSATTRARPSPSSRRCSPSPGSCSPRRAPSTGVRPGWARGHRGPYRGRPSADWPRTTTRGWPTRSPPSSPDPKDTMTDQTLAQLSNYCRVLGDGRAHPRDARLRPRPRPGRARRRDRRRARRPCAPRERAAEPALVAAGVPAAEPASRTVRGEPGPGEPGVPAGRRRPGRPTSRSAPARPAASAGR